MKIKKIITLIGAIVALVSWTLLIQAQNIMVDTQGNYHAVSKERVLKDSTTTVTFTDRAGVVHPVYKSARGSYYIARVSKNGNYYRQYLKTKED
jgi:hypothetical protein